MSSTDFITTSNFVVAAITFAVAAAAYHKQNIAKRFEIFQAFNNRFDKEFIVIRNLLDKDSPQIEHHSQTERHNFLALFEEVAISVKNGVVSFDVAYYFFWLLLYRVIASKYLDKVNGMLSIDSPY